jgi:23S rRNA (adenine2503-C2)-methyltransferase
VPNLKDHSIESLRERLAEDGLRPYRAEQIAAWLYRRGVEDLDAMTDVAREDRERIAARWELRALDVVRHDVSSDGTQKAALRARDGALVEAVLIPEEDRTTLCVSTQVGCPLACSFCATGAMGFTRNLRAAEIVDQVCRMRELLPEGREISNVVFMGMGEPLLNLKNVVQAIRILTHPDAFALAPRRITVSTAGVAPKIAELGQAVPVRLAISLHAATDELRDVLVPLNRRFPLAELLAACAAFPTPKRERISFEYTLIDRVNDAPADAHALARLARGARAKVNLIPLNEHPGTSHRRPSEARMEAFLATLAAEGVTATLRRARGDDIYAACGQLGARSDAQPIAAIRRASIR